MDATKNPFMDAKTETAHNRLKAITKTFEGDNCLCGGTLEAWDMKGEDCLICSDCGEGVTQ